jgi:hypothetical protein
MRLRCVAVLALVCFACGCATHDRGWSGAGATPFDTAQAQCDAKTRELPAGKARENAFDDCMADNGWKRP